MGEIWGRCSAHVRGAQLEDCGEEAHGRVERLHLVRVRARVRARGRVRARVRVRVWG